MYKEFFKDKEGLMVVGDIHGYYVDFRPLFYYAMENNLLLITLGDYVDNGPDSMKVLHKVVWGYNNKAVLPIIGNHDDKFYRYMKNGKVRVGKAMQPTIESGNVYPFVAAKFQKTFEKLLAWASFAYGKRQYTFVHGSYLPTMNGFKTMGDLDKNGVERARALYGETDGTKNDRGYPNRVYNWVENIPANNSVFVGHDIRSKSYPVVQENHKGGRAYFMDTGKKDNGPLSFAVIREDGEVQINQL